MMNEEIYQKLLKIYGKQKMQVFTEIVAELFKQRCNEEWVDENDMYDLHFWKLKNIHLNINTNEDGTDRQTV
jgi:uncharacterized protein with ParB-like and HNH nuclease domain